MKELYDRISKVGKGMKRSQDILEEIVEKKENLPEGVAGLINELNRVLPEAFSDHMDCYDFLRNNIQGVEYPIENPVRMPNKNIDEYNKSAIEENLRKCGVGARESVVLAQDITDTLKEEWGLGKTVVDITIVHHIAYQTLLRCGKASEAYRYKNLRQESVVMPDRKKRRSNSVRRSHRDSGRYSTSKA